VTTITGPRGPVQEFLVPTNRVRVAVILAVIALGAYGGVLWVGALNGAPLTAFTDVGMLLASGASALSALLSARRSRGPARRSWLLIGLGLACWALGDAAWGGYEVLLGEAPAVPSLADVFYLPTLPLVFAGLLLRPIASPRRISRWFLFLDISVVMSAVVGIAWTLVLGPLFAAAGTGSLEVVVSAAYPLGDAMIVVCLALLLLRERRSSRGTALLVAGWLMTALADSIAYIPFDGATYQTGDLLGVVWFAGLLVIAIAAVVDRPSPQAAAVGPLDVGSPWRFVLPSLLIGLAGLVIWAPPLLIDGRWPTPAEAAFALGGTLLLVRYVLGYRDAALAHAREEAWRREEQHLARRDALTGAANRRAFETALAGLARQQPGAGGAPGLVFVDADDFKGYNDAFGHGAGDDALREIVRVLEAESGPGDLVARIGGDEFAVLTAGMEPAAFEGHVARLQAVLRSDRQTSASVGGALWLPSMREPRDLLEAADLSLYEAKRQKVPLAATA
jgi:diguanylate cyclase (GGDEF)-like protein